MYSNVQMLYVGMLYVCVYVCTHDMRIQRFEAAMSTAVLVSGQVTADEKQGLTLVCGNGHSALSRTVVAGAKAPRNRGSGFQPRQAAPTPSHRWVSARTKESCTCVLPQMRNRRTYVCMCIHTKNKFSMNRAGTGLVCFSGTLPMEHRAGQQTRTEVISDRAEQPEAVA